MKTQKQISELKGRPLNGKYYPKIKRIRAEPRHRIRQLLRSFIPPGGLAAIPGKDQQSTD